MVYIIHTLIGKTCEDVRKHRDVRLVRTEKKAKKLVAKPQYLQHIVYSESFAAIQLKKTVVKLDKPRYFNFNIDNNLEESKLSLDRNNTSSYPSSAQIPNKLTLPKNSNLYIFFLLQIHWDVCS